MTFEALNETPHLPNNQPQSQNTYNSYVHTTILNILVSCSSLCVITRQRIKPQTVNEIPTRNIGKNLIRKRSINCRTRHKPIGTQPSKSKRPKMRSLSQSKPGVNAPRGHIRRMSLCEAQCTVGLDINYLTASDFCVQFAIAVEDQECGCGAWRTFACGNRGNGTICRWAFPDPERQAGGLDLSEVDWRA